MDIRDMNNLNGRLSAGSWTGGVWFVSRGYGVFCDGGPLAEAEDGEAEEGRSSGSDGHYAQVMCENWPFEGDGASADIVVFDALVLSASFILWK